MKSNKVKSIPRDAVMDKNMFKAEKVLWYIPDGDALSAWFSFSWNTKRAPVFLSSYRNTSGGFGEREMLWEHKP